jgi:predicted phage baseplate assembly protein
MSGPVDPRLAPLDPCGCCAGLEPATPLVVENRPGLSAIAYRVGEQPQFKRSMLAALSRFDPAGLRALTTRDDDDFSIALVDAWAVVADVLTFYQERIANECYLRTARERLSLLELARLIGYRLRPGVAASTWLAFTIDDASGASGRAAIAAGTRVQSIPGPGESPQTFETVEAIEGRAAWNAMRPALAERRPVRPGDTAIFLQGTGLNLRAGDAILLTGAEVEADPSSTRWEYRRVRTVAEDHAAARTLVTWGAPLSAIAPPGGEATRPRVYALRVRAALFGHNAPDPRTLSTDILGRYGQAPDADWPFAFANREIHLDAVSPSIRPGSFIVMAKPGYHALFRVGAALEASQRNYTLTGKATRLSLDTSSNDNLLPFSGPFLRDTVVFGQSEPLDIAATPLQTPMPADVVTLERRVDGLARKRALIVSGKAMRATVTETAARGKAVLVLDDGTSVPLAPGDVLTLVAPVTTNPAGTVTYRLETAEGRRGVLTLAASQAERQLAWTPARAGDPVLSERATIAAVDDATDPERTILHLTAPLSRSYDRVTVAISANVAAATHGESVGEVLGSGDAGQAFLQLALHQSPLTHVSATTPSGTASTLSVDVNDLRWRERPALFGAGPRDRVFATRTDDTGVTTVEFGDGVMGARPPSGTANIRAAYRKGIGVAGNVKAGQLSLLLSQPLGVKSVVNPLPAGGAADREQLADARRNAPLTVMTLDRVVSLLDYENFARAFAGIAKALATWTWDGRDRSVFVTVAGPGGAEVPAGGALHDNLVAALRAAGDPNVRLRVASYRPATFRLGLRVKRDPDRDAEVVVAAVEHALRAAFSFEAREFGQPVVLSEVIAVIQAVPGVVAAHLQSLHRTDGAPGLETRLTAARPAPGAGASVLGAELLTLDPQPLPLPGVMT